MKKVIYLTLSLSIILSTFIGCSSDDEDSSVLRQTYIDISDFKMYKGSPQGGVEIQFNNLKKKELVSKYLSKVYSPGENEAITLQFNGDKLTYLISNNYGLGRQIVSNYKIVKDTLYIVTIDAAKNTESLRFIALIDANNNYYRRKGLVSYPNPEYDPSAEEGEALLKFKQDSLNTAVNMNTVLGLAGINDIKDLKSPEDTIIWCNVIYPFN